MRDDHWIAYLGFCCSLVRTEVLVECRFEALRDSIAVFARRRPLVSETGGPYKTPLSGRISNRRALSVAFSVLVLVASGWYVARSFRWTEIGYVLKDVNMTLLFLGGGASLIVYWMLRTLRWHVLLRQTGTPVPVVDLYLCTAVSLSFALFTPLQSGEIVKIELLKKYGMITRSPGYGSFLVERAIDLATVLAMACISLLTTLNVLPNRTYAYALIVVLTVGSATAVFLLNRTESVGRARQLIGHMRECVGSAGVLSAVIVITLFSWACVAFGWKILLDSASIHLGFARSIALMSIVALINILSLIPGGLGISEAGSSQLLVRFGFASATAQAGALVLRTYSVLAILLGLIHLGAWRLVREDRHRRGTVRAERAAAAVRPSPIQ